MPDGELTSAQHAIMVMVWSAGREGATIGEIWNAISKTREVRRTTVANLVERLEEREWLQRLKANEQTSGNAKRFVATVSRRKTAVNVSRRIVDVYFEGSATDFIMSYLKSNRPSPAHVRQLKELLAEYEDDNLCRTALTESFRLLLNENASPQQQNRLRKMRGRMEE